jgi:hypothetical protein
MRLNLATTISTATVINQRRSMNQVKIPEPQNTSDMATPEPPKNQIEKDVNMMVSVVHGIVDALPVLDHHKSALIRDLLSKPDFLNDIKTLKLNALMIHADSLNETIEQSESQLASAMAALQLSSESLGKIQEAQAFRKTEAAEKRRAQRAKKAKSAKKTGKRRA